MKLAYQCELLQFDALLCGYFAGSADFLDHGGGNSEEGLPESWVPGQDSLVEPRGRA